MTKKDMAKAIAEETGVPQAQAVAIVQRTFDGIIGTLVTAGRIELRNFGVCEVKRRRPRRARNPRTGDTVKVPARPVVTFKPGREMGLLVGRLKTIPGPDGEAAGNHAR
jgi:integration host factor subunit beta